MPAMGAKTFWASSQRPCYVRTVWVDGFRHAVLTLDDPALARARPSSSGASCGAPARTDGALVRARTASWKRQPELLGECFVSVTLGPHREPPKLPTSDCFDSSDDASEVTNDASVEMTLTARAPPLYQHERAKRNSFMYKEGNATVARCVRDEGERDDERFCERVLEWVDNNDHVVHPRVERRAAVHAPPAVSHRKSNAEEFAAIYRWEEPKGSLDRSGESAAPKADGERAPLAEEEASHRTAHRKSNAEEFAAIYRWKEPKGFAATKVDGERAPVAEEEVSYRQPIYFENAPRTKLHIFLPSLLKNS